MTGGKFQERFEDYYRKVQDGKYLEAHVNDPRNSDPIKDKIQLDTDSREVMAYLNELKIMVNEIRVKKGLVALP